MNIDEHILKALAHSPAGTRFVTINDLARQFGVGAATVRPSAERLIGMGLAEPLLVSSNGVPVLHALRPARPEAAAEPA